MGLSSGLAAISAGYGHTCALTTTGGVKCWGWGGLLGNGNTDDQLTSVDVVGLSSGVTAIASGGFHTCALTIGGAVKCWGGNINGELGDGTTIQRLTPVDVIGLSSGVIAIAAGADHTCVLKGSGEVECWGYNQFGQLGDGTITQRLTPVNVIGLSSGMAAIAAGNGHTCGLTVSGQVKCWGLNNSGELGDGTSIDHWTPVAVVGLPSRITAIATGWSHTCALTSSGGIKCWGSNTLGALGVGSPIENSLVPVDVVGLSSRITAITAGYGHTCALTAPGQVKCWGLNEFGQLGSGDTVKYAIPRDVIGLYSGATALTSSFDHTCAVANGGGVKCWGDNSAGALGDGTTINRPAPVSVVGLSSGISAVASGWENTCALTTSGGVKCWGVNLYGELGIGNDNNIDQLVPLDVMGLSSGVSAIAGGSHHTCTLSSGGGVKCWGMGDNGQLGVGISTRSSVPVNVIGLSSGVAAITAGAYHTCALTTNGGVKCWGANSFGQLGDGTTVDRFSPVDVVGLSSGVMSVYAGVSHTCAVMTGGGIKCWGDNSNGQLGDGTNTSRTIPTDVVGMSGSSVAIAAGQFFTCALTTAGGVKCWGWAARGQLGNGMFSESWTPVDVAGLDSGVTAIITGWDHACALISGGGVKCWGFNYHGQLGIGTSAILYSPVDAVGFN